MQGIKILGTGSYTPDTVIRNSDFAEFLDTSDEWITTRTGISERRMSTDVPNFRMAANAALDALKNSSTSAEEIDYIIVSTCTPDFFYPNMSGLVQHIIGAKNAAVVDVNTACTGFITALDLARNYFLTGKYKKILVVASERVSPHSDYTDRSACILFGDGAGAVVLEPAESDFYSTFGAEGDMLASLYCKVDLSRCNSPFHKPEPELADILNDEQKCHLLQMDGKGVYRFAVGAMVGAVEEVCRQSGMTADDFDIVIPHQANIRIIQSALKSLNVPDEKVIVNLNKRGNTSSACIPTCLDELYKSGRIKAGMKICLVGFGAGLTYGAIIFTA